MGSPIEEKGRTEDEQSHQVTISQDYYLGAMEVTQGQYEKVMGTNHSYFQGRRVKRESSNHPVENVSCPPVSPAHSDSHSLPTT